MCMKAIKKPELLAPAGDLLRLRAALDYGADAVYLGGTVFGMRSAPDNFDEQQLHSAVKAAHAKNVKVYLTVNVLPRSGELDELPRFLSHAKDCGVDALIISDLGVLDYAKQYAPGVAIHISTQAGVVNYAAANAFYKLGARRIVPARELSLEELRVMRRNIPDDLELECFIHGAMCVSFSGRCLLSNYLTGRDANHGDCAQPCRWKYALTEEKRPGQYFPIDDSDGGTFILNSREGRAKSEYYVSVVTNAYRRAIDGYLRDPKPDYAPPQWVRDELEKVSYRPYCTGFFFGDPSDESNISLQGGYTRQWDVMAVCDRWEAGVAFCTQRNRFFVGDTLEVLAPRIDPFPVKVTALQNADGEAIEATNHPMMAFSFPCEREIPKGAFLRKMREPDKT